MNNSLAPIVLFVYNRPWHTRQTLEALSRNLLADQSKLYIYADGPKEGATEEQKQRLMEVRALLKERQWCGEVEVIERDENKGLAKSIVAGITEVIDRHGKVIVMEDDLVTASGFLKYMNAALRVYADKEEIMHVSGFIEPVKEKLPTTFFLILASCWGWGTWSRAWKHFNRSALDLWVQIPANRVSDFNMGLPHDKMLKDNISNNLSWAILWHASVFVREGLCLHPSASLVRNIGNDSSGENCGDLAVFKNQAITDYIEVSEIPIVESTIAKKAVISFYGKEMPPAFSLRQTLGRFIADVLGKIKVKKKHSDQPQSIDWADHSMLLENWGRGNVWKEISDFFSDKKGRVLDIGCGTGIGMEILRQNTALDLHGCDISEVLLLKARERGIDDFRLRKCSATDLSVYKDGEFDYLYCIGVIQYFSANDIDRFVNELSRVAGKSSFIMVPVSFSNSNEGWVSTWQSYHNNSIEWWVEHFLKKFKSVEIADSAWVGESSVGKWIVCSKE